MEQKRFSFGKEEKLCRLKLIQQLFAEGKGFVKYPLKISYLEQDELPESVACQVLVSVSKKKFKRANKRNRIKRQIRECYRLNKHLLTDALQQSGKKIVIAFIYLPTDEMLTADIEKAMVKALTQLRHLVCEVEQH